MTQGIVEDSVVWHDVECGGYKADLVLWEELAEASTGPVLELGCGTGRVALDLARRGHPVTAIDHDVALVSSLRERAARERLELHAENADASRFSLQERFGLIVAPMQLIQLLPSSEARRACWTAVAAHLAPAGRAALAIIEDPEAGVPPSPLLPDVRERDGWVYSSLPLGASREGDVLVVERLRQTVDPEGHLTEGRNTVLLRLVSAVALEREAQAAGLSPIGRRRIEPTDAHVGSTVLLLEGR